MALSRLGSASLRLGRLGALGALVLAGASGVACSSDGGGRSTVGGGSGNGGSGKGGSGNGGSGNGGGISVGTGGQSGGGDGDGNYCDTFEQMFVPQTPTVMILVDRSSSMWPNYWDPLKTGVLNVVQELQADVRFGFAAFTGVSGQTCPLELDELGSISENNAQAIADYYNGLPQPNKSETPTPAAIAAVRDTLLADDSPGDRFILLVTDGEPDFCNDGNQKCPQDALIGELQESYRQGIRTLVFGLGTVAALDYYANAGAGQPVNWSDGLVLNPDQGSLLKQECASVPEWGALPKPAGLDTVGEYSDTAGSASAFVSSDPAALAEQIRSTVEGLKSCTIEFNFDVKDDTAGRVYIGTGDDFKVEENVIPREDWRMSSENVIELMGDSCTLWQQEGVDRFFAGFPCEAIVVR